MSTLHGLCAQARTEPATLTLFRGWTRLTTDEQGEMQGAPLHGFFAAETQFITHYDLKLSGRNVRHRLGVQLAPNEWSCVGALMHSGDSGDLPEGTIPKGSVELRVLRKIDEGWSELVIIRNNGTPHREVTLEISLCCPIRDSEFTEEKKQDRKLPKSGLVPEVVENAGSIEMRFHRSFGKRRHAPGRELEAAYADRAPRNGQEITRDLTIVAHVLDDPHVRLQVEPGKITTLRAHLELATRQEVRLLLSYEPSINGVRMRAPDIDGLGPLPRNDADRSIRLMSSNASLDLILGQAIADLESLELPIFGPRAVESDNYRAFNAGIPRYIGLFGRDNLVTARHCMLFCSARVEPVLSRIALLQGVRRDNWRDEQPGRLLHERRLDPDSQIGSSNREIYYGDVTATPFWILVLADLYRWTGDRALLERQRGTLERCCDWLVRRLERGNGFIYYEPSAAKHENRNQAWKDSGDAIVDSDGRVRVPPLAVCEVQGYAHQALREAAHLFELLGRDGDDLRARARDLKLRFDQRFWQADDNFYALALDRDGAAIASRASNIGHCLGTSIIADDKLEHVVRALLADDMFSGWGIRTLSCRNPAYDPFSYHRGSVWPAENAMIAAGLRLRGFHAEAERITTAQLTLAAVFEHMRLPEVFAGHARTSRDPVPGIYNFANPLQAWSVSAIARHVQSMLGIWPRADQHVVYLDPQLPPWIERIEIRNLVVAGERLALRFWREADGHSKWQAIEPTTAVELRDGIDHDFA